MTTDVTTPTGLIEAFGRRLSAGDLDGALALYEPDAIFQASPGTWGILVDDPWSAA
jgi:hypothetical protein